MTDQEYKAQINMDDVDHDVGKTINKICLLVGFYTVAVFSGIIFYEIASAYTGFNQLDIIRSSATISAGIGFFSGKLFARLYSQNGVVH